MKTIFSTLFLVLFIGCSQAQTKEIKWLTSMDEAIVQSQKENKPIMLFFTGSDWCGWCIRLQKEVFFQDAFKTWANETVIAVEVDFPRNKFQTQELKNQNATLQKQFGVQGYPTVWFVKPEATKDGKINLLQLGTSGYRSGGPSNWIGEVNGFLNK
jgi:thioredoxin-related protein